MWPEVLQAVMGRRLEGEPATLEGYTRLRVIGQHYPVIVVSLDDSVAGILYQGLTADEFGRLDAFEGEEYDRIGVCLGDAKAFAYVLSDDCRHIAAPEPWHPEQLTPGQLASFCSEYKGWSEV